MCVPAACGCALCFSSLVSRECFLFVLCALRYYMYRSTAVPVSLVSAIQCDSDRIKYCLLETKHKKVKKELYSTY